MKNFDQFIGIDWSGAKAPINTKSIAVASCAQGQEAPELLVSGTPGHWSRSDVFEFILKLLKTSKRCFIGIDANFGYAQEVGMEQFRDIYDYRDLWGAVEAENKGEGNFFAQKYWEQYPQYFWTEGKQPAHITLPKRITETQCAADGYGRPESPFKLIGPKQVGKGGLAAMRMAYHLKKEASDQICIWPFEKDIEDTSQIVISEIYPRQFLMRSGHGVEKVKSLQDLNEALEKLCSNIIKNDTYRFNDHDADAIVSCAGIRMLCGSGKALLKPLSNPPMLDALSAQREGWIFGVGDRG